MRLFHFSDDPAIHTFEPRVINNQHDESAKVWAIDAEHAAHYYVPRECPRICVHASEGTKGSDKALFFGMSETNRMIAIESAWYDRVRQGHIYKYSVNADDFQLYDANAGYYISTKSVRPIAVERMDDLIGAILQEGIELRVTPSLMLMKERVLASTLHFSMIRMRNASQ
ncbi:hypothetical protein M3231_27625 [Neobacillus mesonae]|nr:hypothetical protein [Neobacillus mesonae]